MGNPTMTVEVGRLLCGEVRHFLKTCQFKGIDIMFLESDGGIERDFVISGKTEDLKIVKRSLDSWMETLNT